MAHVQIALLHELLHLVLALLEEPILLSVCLILRSGEVEPALLHELLDAVLACLEELILLAVCLVLRSGEVESALLHDLFDPMLARLKSALLLSFCLVLRLLMREPALLHELLDAMLATLEAALLLAIGLALRFVMRESTLLHETLDAVLARLHELLRPHAALAGRDLGIAGRDGQGGIDRGGLTGAGRDGAVEQPSAIRRLFGGGAGALDVWRVRREQSVQSSRDAGERLPFTDSRRGLARGLWDGLPLGGGGSAGRSSSRGVSGRRCGLPLRGWHLRHTGRHLRHTGGGLRLHRHLWRRRGPGPRPAPLARRFGVNK